MKVGIDARMYGLEHAGIGRYVESLVTELVNQKPNDEIVLFLRKKYFDKLIFGKNVTKVLADFGHYTLSEQWKFLAVLNKPHLDIMHFPHFNFPILYRRPFVVTIHDLLWHSVKGAGVTSLSPLVYSIKYFGYRLVSYLAVQRAKKVIVPSSWVMHEVLEKMNPEASKIAVIFEGIDKDYINGKPGSSYKDLIVKLGLAEPYIVYTGNAYPHKNLRRLVKAMVVVNKNRKKKLSLVIVSARTVFLDQLRRYINEQGASMYIVIAGFLNDKEVVSLYEHAIALIHPSTSEGFGLTGLEAMATGVPVVASRAGSLPEIYRDAALYFNPYSVADMAKKIVLITGSLELRQKYIDEGEKLVKLYSWTDMASETWDLYKNALGK